MLAWNQTPAPAPTTTLDQQTVILIRAVADQNPGASVAEGAKRCFWSICYRNPRWHALSRDNGQRRGSAGWNAFVARHSSFLISHSIADTRTGLEQAWEKYWKSRKEKNASRRTEPGTNRSRRTVKEFSAINPATG
jgi:hypothetical protein